MQNLVYLDKNGSKQKAFLDAIAIWIPRALNSANDENLSPGPQQLWHVPTCASIKIHSLNKINK